MSKPNYLKNASQNPLVPIEVDAEGILRGVVRPRLRDRVCALVGMIPPHMKALAEAAGGTVTRRGAGPWTTLSISGMGGQEVPGVTGGSYGMGGNVYFTANIAKAPLEALSMLAALSVLYTPG